MNAGFGGQILRFKKVSEYQGKPKKYRHTYRIAPEGTEDTLFACDVIGHVSLAEVIFLDSAGAPCFAMRPNRKIMPMYWPVTDARGKDLGQVKQHVFKGGNWSGWDVSDREVFRIVKPESLGEAIGNAVLGGYSKKYCFMQQGTLLATTEQEPRSKPTKGGVRGFFQALMIPDDWVIRFEVDAADVDIRLVLAAMILLIDMTIAMDRAD